MDIQLVALVFLFGTKKQYNTISKIMANNTRDNNRKPIIEHWMKVTVYLIIYDAMAVTLSYFLALLLRFDFKFSLIPPVYLIPWMYWAPFYAVTCIVVFSRLKLYRSIWRFASFTELERITLASIITTMIHIIGVTVFLNVLVRDTLYSMNRMPISYYVIGAIIQFVLIVAVRFSYRFVLLMRSSRTEKSADAVMLIGLNSIIKAT